MSKYSVRIWTSCHGSDNHFLPQSLEQLFLENDFIEMPEVHSVPGRFLKHEVVEEIRIHLSNVTQPHINILMLSENNIKSCALKGAFKVYKHTKEIIELHKNTPHGLLICGMLPCPKHYSQIIALSEFTDDKIQLEVTKLHQTGDVSFANLAFIYLASIFKDNEGFLLNKMYFEKDEVHLNESGAFTLARNLLDYACDLARAMDENSD